VPHGGQEPVQDHRQYVSGNVAVVQTELRIGYIEKSGVNRVLV
jgi:hypothetical protein